MCAPGQRHRALLGFGGFGVLATARRTRSATTRRPARWGPSNWVLPPLRSAAARSHVRALGDGGVRAGGAAPTAASAPATRSRLATTSCPRPPAWSRSASRNPAAGELSRVRAAAAAATSAAGCRRRATAAAAVVPPPPPAPPAEPIVDRLAEALAAEKARSVLSSSCVRSAKRERTSELRRARRFASAKRRLELRLANARHTQRRRACVRRHGRVPGRVNGLTAVATGKGGARLASGRPAPPATRPRPHARTSSSSRRVRSARWRTSTEHRRCAGAGAPSIGSRASSRASRSA